MTYAQPSLGLVGSVSSVVLGTASTPDADNGGDSTQPLYKPEDIVAGLDE
jgi:hypothetical protein